MKLEPDDARHLTRVLRLRTGDAITVVCQGTAWDAALAGTRDACEAVILRPSSECSGELPVPVAVLQAMPKGAKMDLVVEKVTELGASAIVPLRCDRSETQGSAHKLERWRRIARASAQQSRRLRVPDVEEAQTFSAAIARFTEKSTVLVAWERASPGSLFAALEAYSNSGALALVIGPEGSFSESEIQCARKAGCSLVSLGPTTLRTETAAAAALCAVAGAQHWW